MQRIEHPEAISSVSTPGTDASWDGDGEASACPPPPRPPVRLGAGVDRLLLPARRPRELETPLPAPPGYELLEEIGRGGMGVVFKARQCELNRLVAVKTMRTGALASVEEQRRFRLEAQAAARLCHPHIVQVHDVGETAGLAYLILEYVEGGSLTRRLAEGPLSARDAAALTQVLAHAVHYAHSCGIVHRDLKPANVLLACSHPESATADSSPLTAFTPKLTDFGLAKLLGADAEQTQSGAILGTPSYMAPEQASGRVAEAGPATDVYALGAMLYEMLTGRPPFRGATPLDTLDQVRTREPVPPRQLQTGIPRDLETICLKCLHKEPGRRYPSADALAEDLRRFVDGAPIQARRVGLGERGVKWVRRRPLTAVLAACILAAALALAGVGLSYHFELEHALQATRQQRDRAENYYGKMLEAVDTLLTEVGDKDLADVPEMEEARSRLFEKALQIHEGLLDGENDDDPTNRLQRARLLYRIAALIRWSAAMEHTETYAQRSIALCRQLVAEAPDNLQYRRELGRALSGVGQVYETMDRHAETQSLYRQAREVREALPLDEPLDRFDLAHSCILLGFRCLEAHPDEARTLLDRASALLESTPALKGTRAAVTQVYLGQGVLHQQRHRVVEAEAAYRKGLDAGQGALRDARWVGFNHFIVAEILHNLAMLKWDPLESTCRHASLSIL